MVKQENRVLQQKLHPRTSVLNGIKQLPVTMLNLTPSQTAFINNPQQIIDKVSYSDLVVCTLILDIVT